MSKSLPVGRLSSPRYWRVEASGREFDRIRDCHRRRFADRRKKVGGLHRRWLRPVGMFHFDSVDFQTGVAVSFHDMLARERDRR